MPDLNAQSAKPLIYLETKPGQKCELLPGSSLYPEKLRHVEAPPKKLCLVGNVKALNRPAIAIVGARKATPYGLACAKRFAKRAASQGLAIVSGGAIGCDQAAHRGALEVEAPTIVVLGCGADIVYPSKAKELYQEVIASGGALVSEAPWGSAPHKWAFRKRNRIIAALASVTLIVEAGLPSGTFQTADATLALGNELLVVPGSIFSKESRGSNQLAQQGAIPIIDDQSFDEAMELVFGPKQLRICLNFAQQGLSDGEAQQSSSFYAKVLAALQAQPMLPDQLVGLNDKTLVEVVRLLSKMEIDGLVARLRDGRYMANPV